MGCSPARALRLSSPRRNFSPRPAIVTRLVGIAAILAGDWFGKVDPSTDTPRTGPLRMGEVVVEDLSNGQIHRGADGIELIARNIPAYLPLRLLLKVPLPARQ